MISEELLNALAKRAADNMRDPRRPNMQVDPHIVDEFIKLYREMNYPIKSNDNVQTAVKSNGKLPDLRELHDRLSKGIDPVLIIARAVLESGWNYVDVRGRMKMEPARVEDFLHSCEFEHCNWAEFIEQYPARAKFMGMILESYHATWRTLT